VAGVAHSFNLIDGYHGLSGAVAVIILTALGYVAFQIKDYPIMVCSLAGIGAIVGFLFWNYPRGLIFLGDGGAYLIGFWIAALSILLVVRNRDVSPWFACLINIYPAFETMFSIWRKKMIRKISPGQPDGAHLHMLIYGRIARWMRIDDPNKSFLANARTAPFLWVLAGTTIIPAILLWRNTLALQLMTLLFCIFYLAAYRALVLFKMPKWFL
jgi:UDP-N-acetylmuramyl pentapeptide phosphotransferase/UDP-N-acetylglucosamine-1-phosphate transferase